MSISSVFACLAMLAWLQTQKVQNQEIKALTVSSEAFLLSNRNFDALIASIRAGRLLKSSLGVDRNTRIRLLEALQKAMYNLRERNRLEGHTAPVESVSFSPDGEMLASASYDGTVKLWSREGELLETLEADKTVVRSVSFSPCGKFLASAGDDGIVKLWHLDDERFGRLYKTIPKDKDSTFIYSVNFSPNKDDPILAVAHENRIKLWDSNGKLIDDTLEAHPAGIWSVSFSPDGERLASADDRGFVKLWKLQDDKKWKLDKTLSHGSPVYKIRFSRDSKILASASQNGTVKLWNGQGQFLSTCEGHDDEIWGLSFSPKEQILATASDDGTVRLWNWSSDRCQPLQAQPLAILSGKGNDLSFSPNGQWLAVATQDWQIKLLKVYPPLLEIPKIFPTTHTDDIKSMSLSPDGEIIATGDMEGIIELRSKSNGKLISPPLHGHDNWIYDLDFSPNHKLLASGGKDNKICLWRENITKNITETWQCNSLQHESRAIAIDFSPDSQFLASGSTDGKFHLWNLGDKKPFFSERSHGDKDRGILVWDVDISPDGQTIATVGQDGSIKLFSRKDEKLLAFPHGHRGAIYSVSFHPEREILTTASADQTIKLWNLKGKLLATLEGHTNEVLDVSFSDDGQFLASASHDGTVKLWNLKGELLNTFHGHQLGLKRVRFSPNGKTLISVSGGTDGAIILWNREDFKLDALLKRGCKLLRDYFQNNIHVSQEDRRFCSGYWSF